MYLPANEKESQLSGRVLVVEDNEINQFFLKKLFKKWGLSGEFVENGLQAVEKVTENQYDAVLMDIQMPVMGGIEATSIIRTICNGMYRDLPIIALTASIMDQDKADIMNSGMNAYITKPFVPQDLYAKLSVVLKAHSAPAL